MKGYTFEFDISKVMFDEQLMDLAMKALREEAETRVLAKEEKA